MRPAQPPSAKPFASTAIAAVPASVQATVRSQSVITSVAEALAEVVANALDAGATEVNVDVALAPKALSFRVQDNGSGVPAASMALLGQRFATSKALPLSRPASRSGAACHAALSCAPPARCPLGYRGEALAAIREAAGAVEVTSRAAGSFETLTVTLQPGGQAAGPALAPEQRVRQGTVVAVRELFATQPVRRKALLSTGLQREADRCGNVVLRMALLRPGVTFTLFDRGRRAFVLRLMKGRSELNGAAEFLGRPPQLVAALQPAPEATYAVSGYASLPPYGQPGTTHQCIYVNGRWVKAPPVVKLVDSIFLQCYKPNVRLLEGQGEELQAVRKASNKHAAFVLHIRWTSCSPCEYELSHEPEGELVQFRSWETLLAAVQRSLLAAWRLALSNSLLRQLEQLEGGGGVGPAAEGPGRMEAAALGFGMAAVTAAEAGAVKPNNPPGGMSFQHWLRDQGEHDNDDDFVQAQTAASPPGAAAVAGAANAPGGPSSGSSGQRSWSGGQKMSGAKHTLASRLVRYNGATALPLDGGSIDAAGHSSAPVYSGQQHVEVQGGQENWEGSGAWLCSEYATSSQQLPLRQHSTHQQQQQAPVAYSCQVLASRFPQHHFKHQRREKPLQALNLQVASGVQAWHQAGFAPELPAGQPPVAWELAEWQGELHGAAEGLDAIGGLEDQQPEATLQQLLAGLPTRPAHAVQQLQCCADDAWGQQEQQPALQWMMAEEQWAYELEQQQGGQQPWKGMGGSSRRLRLGTSEAVVAMIDSWGGTADDKPLSLPDSWAAGLANQPQERPGRSSRSRLAAEERMLLQHMAESAPIRLRGQRPQSTPPHHHPRPRIEAVRQPRPVAPLAEVVPGQAVVSSLPSPPAAMAVAEAAVAAEALACIKSSEHQQSRLQDTALRQYSSSAEQSPSKGGGSQLPGGKRPAIALSLGSTATQQVWAAAQRKASAAGPSAAQQAVPDFLRPDASLNELVATWRRPAAAGQPAQRCAAVTGSSDIESILSLEALSTAAFARLKPTTLTREQLGQARALQQVDRKFVPIVCGSLLALVDQHAADERVQLERLRDLLLGPDGQPRAPASQVLRTPLPLDLTDAEQHLLEAYRHKAEAWGWRWMVPAQQGGRGSGFVRQAAPLLTHVPLLWGATLRTADLKLYLYHLHDTCGAGGLPAGVVRVLNSKACRGAIMFGDVLHQGDCQALLHKLAATQLCFSCAHGRPTTVPVVDLRLLQQALRLHAEARMAAADGCGNAAADAARQNAGLSGLKARLQAVVQ